jgi:hypothetical protein
MKQEESYEEIKSKNFKFGAVGDYIKGTLTDVNKTTSKDAYGKLSHIYSVKADEGSFLGSTKNEKTGKYVQDTEPTTINKDEAYTFFVSDDKGVLIGAMKDIKIGQKFMIKFTELKPTTKGNDAKIVKVFAGKYKDGSAIMDQAWLDAGKTEEELAQEEFNKA